MARLQRLRPVHRRMSFAAFQRLPHRLGWKHGYYGGTAHLRPSSVTVAQVLKLSARPEDDRFTLRAVTPADARLLRRPFLEAFARSPEYVGYPHDKFRQAAAKYVTGFFGDVRGEWSPLSVLATAGRRIAGAALVKRRTSGPLLDCLFVRPDYARQGLATALAGRVVNGLLREGESKLLSFVLLANGPSLAWHRQFGFREVPDLSVASHRWRHFQYEIERHRDMNDLPDAELDLLEKAADSWLARVKRLEALERRDFWAAHPRFD